MIMTALQEGFYLLRQLRQLFGKVLGPAKALASDGAIEAFDKDLLVLFVRTRDPVLFFQEVGALFPGSRQSFARSSRVLARGWPR